MRAVLYANDMEPINVIELAPFAVDYLQRRGEVILHVMETLSPARVIYDTNEPICFRKVRIRAEWLDRRGERHMMLFTDDDESALLLRSDLLPGQRRGAQEERRKAFVKGFMRAFEMLGR